MRQRSVNSTQLTFKPLALPHLMASAITELRQSTTVPNISKTQAFTEPSAALTLLVSGAACCAIAAVDADRDVAIMLAPVATKNPRRLSLSGIRSPSRVARLLQLGQEPTLARSSSLPVTRHSRV